MIPIRAKRRVSRLAAASMAIASAFAVGPLTGVASAQPIPGPVLPSDQSPAPAGCHYTYDTVGLQAPAVSLRCDGVPEAAGDNATHSWVKCVDPQGLIHIHVGNNINPAVPSVSTAFCTVGDQALYWGPARYFDFGWAWY